MDKIIKYDIPMTVKVRKHDINTDKLSGTLKKHKKETKLSNTYIAETLNKPKTLVEHWFRSDECFSIPDEDIWVELKKLLNIETDEFDLAVTEFEYRDGIYEKANRVYDTEGIAPTLTTVGVESIIDLGSRNKLNNKIKIKGDYNMEKLRVFEAFCGYGSQSIALENIGVPHEVVAISDIDADVLISYGAIRGDLDKQIDLSDDEIKEWLMARNIGWDFQKQKSSIPRMKKDKLYKLYNACIQHNCLGDVSIINPSTIPDHDLFTYSFPCTDISVAGQMKGLTRDSGTRSGLLWECEKIIAAKKPKYLLMENVKNLVGKQFKPEFDKWCEWLEEQGYRNFYKVLNAKDYGIPQNRERVFMVSILDENATYGFPEKFPLELRLKDVLEDVVEEKYYLEQKHVDKILNSKFMQEKLRIQEGDTCGTLLARDYKDPKCVKVEDELKPKRVGGIFDDEKSTHQAGSVWDSSHVSPTVDTCQGGYRQPCVFDYRFDDGVRVKLDGNAHCVNASHTGTSSISGQTLLELNYRIRKLTPKECWRLMGMKDEHFERCVNAGLSNSQLYKQAGNSIVVDVLEYIFKELFKEYIVSTDTENFTQPQGN